MSYSKTSIALRLEVVKIEVLRLEVVKIEVLRLEVVKIKVLRPQLVKIKVLRLEVVKSLISDRRWFLSRHALAEPTCARYRP